jgi:uncharacterized OsmC-like protein
MRNRYVCRAILRAKSDSGFKVEAEGACGSIHFGLREDTEASCRLNPYNVSQIWSWTPEHLFLAVVVGSYAGTFRELAAMDSLKYSTLEIEAEGKVQLTASGIRFTEIVIDPSLALARESDRKRALRLLGTAAQRAVIPQSIRPTVQLQHVVTVSAAAA